MPLNSKCFQQPGMVQDIVLKHRYGQLQQFAEEVNKQKKKQTIAAMRHQHVTRRKEPIGGRNFGPKIQQNGLQTHFSGA